MVEIGYKNECSGRGLIKGKIPFLVYNKEDLNKIGKDNIVLLGKIGNKNKYELAKECLARKLEIMNLNARRFVKKTEKKFKNEIKQEAKK